jgi:arylsulfatase A-like enzyme
VAMITTKRWKYVHFPNLGVGELYDLENDPHEFENLFYEPEHAGTLAEIRLRLLNRFMNNQAAFIGERTKSFREHFESDHRPPGGTLPGVTYAPPEIP